MEADGVSLRNLNEKNRREVRQYPEEDVELKKHVLGRKREEDSTCKTMKDAEENERFLVKQEPRDGARE